MKKGHNFRKLEIWKMSMTLVKKVYTVSQEIPKNEKYGLVSQIQRCAVSIPSNIADGSGRTTEKDFRYFLKIALSSSYELETQLILLHELYGLNTENLILELSDVQNMIGGFIRSLNSN
jgi:four helix bundle protein